MAIFINESKQEFNLNLDENQDNRFTVIKILFNNSIKMD